MKALAAIVSNAQKAARCYKRRCWWAEVEDLEQEAVRAQLEALPKFDPTYHIDQNAYLWIVALYSVRRFVLHASSPVSGSKHRPENMIGMHRAALEECADMGAFDHTEDEVLRVLFAQRVRARVCSLLEAEDAEFALGVLSQVWSVRETEEA